MHEITVVNLAQKFGLFSEHWSPKIIAQVNDMHVKVVKVQGEFVWHSHDDEDELFLVVAGSLTIRLRDRDLRLGPGELVVIPRGVEHQPIAPQECHIVLLEPAGTLNTGDAADPREVADPEWI